MRGIGKSVIGSLLVVLAILGVWFVSVTTPVYAEGEQPTSLVVKLNGQALAESSEEKVTPGVSYHLSVFNSIGDTASPQAVKIEILDKQGNDVESKLVANDTYTDYTLSINKADSGKTIRITFTTKETEPKEVTVSFKVNYLSEKIALNKKSHTMNIKDKLTLTAKVTPDKAVNKEIQWKSSNTKIATVNNGVVTAITPGQCIITVSLKDGTLPVTCKITVRKPTFNSTSKTIASGKQFTLKVMYLKNKVTWKSSNTKIATVKNGVVTAKKTGNVTITAKGGGYTMTCKVRVTNPQLLNSSGEAVEGITVTKGFSRILNVKGGAGDVTWKSSNEKIATVKDGKIKGIKLGTCNVYATVNGKTLKCKVTVKSNVFKTTPIKNGRYMRRGKVDLSNASMYYSKGKLIYKCYAVNSTSYLKVSKYNNITIAIYVDNKLVAKQSYKDIKLNLTKNKSKALTFTFDTKNVKTIANLRTGKIKVSYTYGYQYYN